MVKVISLLLGLLLVLSTLIGAKKAFKYYSSYRSEALLIKDVQLNSPDSLVNQSDSLLIPINYKGSLDFRNLNPDTRKEQFILQILPAIVITREQLLDELHHVEFIESRIKGKKSISEIDSIFLNSLKQRYETDSLSELRKRIYPHPVSLALAQAALESGWGTSNIFRNGRNIFGVMSFSSEDSRSLIQYTEGDDERYLRTYSSIKESVEHYFQLIATVSSYKKFRQKRWEGSASSQLVKYLSRYHDSTDQYAEMAQSIIASNNLERFDNIAIHPNFKQIVSLREFLMQY
jgi:Bax protein